MVITFIYWPSQIPLHMSLLGKPYRGKINDISKEMKLCLLMVIVGKIAFARIGDFESMIFEGELHLRKSFSMNPKCSE